MSTDSGAQTPRIHFRERNHMPTSNDTRDASHELDAQKKLQELIKDIRIAMVTSTGDNGDLHTRPMYVQQTEFDGDLWFATSKSSSLVKELRDHGRVLATFASPDDQRYVVVRGEGFGLKAEATKS
jgi:general stress protein 26